MLEPKERSLHSFKYGKDNPKIYGFATSSINENKDEMEEVSHDSERASLLSHSVLISKDVFPDIFEAIQNSKNRLRFDKDINFFVTSNPFPNGYCRVLPNLYSADIVLTSSLIELLSLEELSYIIGHEIAHFLFEHHKYPRPDIAANEIEMYNLMALQRAGEISADRLGFISCGSEKISFKTKLKLSSGLSDKFIKGEDDFYLKQMEQLKKNVDRSLAESSHPSFLSRIYALHLFAHTHEYKKWVGSRDTGSYSLKEIDQKIEKNLEELSGNERSLQNQEAFESAYLWISVYLFMKDGTFSKGEQIAYNEFFSNIDIKQVLSALKIGKREELENRFQKNLFNASSLEISLKEKLMHQIEFIASKTDSSQEVMLKILVDIANRLEIKRPVTIRKKI